MNLSANLGYESVLVLKLRENELEILLESKKIVKCVVIGAKA